MNTSKTVIETFKTAGVEYTSITVETTDEIVKVCNEHGFEQTTIETTDLVVGEPFMYIQDLDNPVLNIGVWVGKFSVPQDSDYVMFKLSKGSALWSEWKQHVDNSTTVITNSGDTIYMGGNNSGSNINIGSNMSGVTQVIQSWK